MLLVVTGSIVSGLEDLSGKIFQDGGKIHQCSRGNWRPAFEERDWDLLVDSTPAAFPDFDLPDCTALPDMIRFGGGGGEVEFEWRPWWLTTKGKTRVVLHVVGYLDNV